MTILISHKCLVKDCPEVSHKWEYTQPTMREFMVIQETLGMDPQQFGEALLTVSTGVTLDGARALVMLVTLQHRRDGLAVAYDDVDVAIEEFEIAPDPTPEEPEGKAPGTPTTPSHPPGDHDSSTSGAETAAASELSASTTPPTSGSSTE